MLYIYIYNITFLEYYDNYYAGMCYDLANMLVRAPRGGQPAHSKSTRRQLRQYIYMYI